MLIVGNWKAYVDSPQEAKQLAAATKRAATKTRAKVVIVPSFAHLGFLAKAGRSSVSLGAQDVSLATLGAHTGEVTASMLRRLPVSYVIVGHSERRAAGETDALIAEKTKRALEQGLTPILCVGETARDGDARYLQTLRMQLEAVYSTVLPKDRAKIIVAYEPVWAIGKTARDAISANDLIEMILYIRKVLTPYLPQKGAGKVTILYGGSVEPGNVRDLAGGSRVDGFLVGHASADAKTFSALIQALS
jgi:triosephosphate isomerase